MANHCFNYITLYGCSDKLSIITDRFNKIDGFYFANYSTLFGKDIITEYDEFTRINNGDVYEVYGSKWFDANSIDYCGTHYSLTIMGDSAWSPMVPLFIYSVSTIRFMVELNLKNQVVILVDIMKLMQTVMNQNI